MASARQDMEQLKIHHMTAHDWEEEKLKHKNSQLFDDGTMSFFWRAHTVTVLFIFILVLFYVGLFEEVVADRDYNAKRGLVAVVLAFLLFEVIQTPDGPFVRPHPAFWRFILCLSILYELALVYLLFQTKEDAKLLMKHFDEDLGKPLPERDYGGNCYLYDSHNANPFHNVIDKFDIFVVSHFIGWWLKTLVVRDWWLCTVLSISFELLEYSLEHQLPNFRECWWDHWIMDALVCNGFGIYLGMKTLRYLSMKPYHWRGMWNIPTYGGKLRRVAAQFTPYSWTDFTWRPTASLKRWGAVCGIIVLMQLVELNAFYLKFVLCIPSDHYLCMARLLFYFFMGSVSLRETFQYLDDPSCKKFGRQSWIAIAVVVTECLIVMKFDWGLITKPLPETIAAMWCAGFICLVSWTVWKFYIKRDVKNDVATLIQDTTKSFTLTNPNGRFM